MKKLIFLPNQKKLKVWPLAHGPKLILLNEQIVGKTQIFDQFTQKNGGNSEFSLNSIWGQPSAALRCPTTVERKRLYCHFSVGFERPTVPTCLGKSFVEMNKEKTLSNEPASFMFDVLCFFASKLLSPLIVPCPYVASACVSGLSALLCCKML